MHGLFLDFTHISPLSAEERKEPYKGLGCRRNDLTLSPCVILGLSSVGLIFLASKMKWLKLITSEAFLSLRFYDFMPLRYEMYILSFLLLFTFGRVPLFVF